MRRPDGGFFPIDLRGAHRSGILRGRAVPARRRRALRSLATLCPLSLQVGMELALLTTRAHRPVVDQHALEPTVLAVPTTATVAERRQSVTHRLSTIPSSRVQDFNLSPAPQRPTEPTEFRAYRGPQQPIGVEGRSTSGFELCRIAGVSDLETFLSSRIESGTAGNMSVDRNWAWLLSAYGLANHHGARAVEQLLRQAIASTRISDPFLDRRVPLLPSSFLSNILVQVDLDITIVMESQEEGETRHSQDQQDGGTRLHSALPSPENSNSSHCRSGVAGAQEAEPLAQMRTPVNVGSSITENCISSSNSSSRGSSISSPFNRSSSINSSDSRLGSSSGRTYSTQRQSSMRSHSGATAFLAALEEQSWDSQSSREVEGHSNDSEANHQTRAAMEAAEAGGTRSIGSLPGSSAEHSFLNSVEAGADGSQGHLHAPWQIPRPSETMVGPSEGQEAPFIVAGCQYSEGNIAQQTVSGGAVAAPAQGIADPPNGSGPPAAQFRVFPDRAQPASGNCTVPFQRPLGGNPEEWGWMSEELPSYASAWDPPPPLHMDLPAQATEGERQMLEEYYVETERGRAELHYIRTFYFVPPVRRYLQFCSNRGLRVPSLQNIPTGHPTIEQVDAYLAYLGRQPDTSMYGETRTAMFHALQAAEATTEVAAAATEAATVENVEDDNAGYIEWWDYSDDGSFDYSDDFTETASGTDLESASETASGTGSETQSGSAYEGLSEEEFEWPEDASGHNLEDALSVTSNDASDSLGDFTPDVEEDVAFDIAFDGASDAASDDAASASSEAEPESASDRKSEANPAAASDAALSDAEATAGSDPIADAGRAPSPTEVPLTPDDALIGSWVEEQLGADSWFVSPEMSAPLSPPAEREILLLKPIRTNGWRPPAHGEAQRQQCRGASLDRAQLQQQTAKREGEEQEQRQQKEQEQRRQLEQEERRREELARSQSPCLYNRISSIESSGPLRPCCLRRGETSSADPNSTATLDQGPAAARAQHASCEGSLSVAHGFNDENVSQVPQQGNAQQFVGRSQRQQTSHRPAELGRAPGSSAAANSFPATSQRPLSPRGCRLLSSSILQFDGIVLLGAEITSPAAPFREGPLRRPPSAEALFQTTAQGPSDPHNSGSDEQTESVYRLLYTEYPREAWVEEQGSSTPLLAGTDIEEPRESSLALPVNGRGTGVGGPSEAAADYGSTQPLQRDEVEEQLRRTQAHVENIERILQRFGQMMEFVEERNMFPSNSEG
ncbi:LOW QUALITY PROTEIN: uncharacterized protein EMH_0069130 [Eimeria mitis]|uniref:Uncharacterized protein n=1 Tax=Eimeria mitis TaxID=44415 RepID=U6KAA9_9EIME|nr:LOW QUALITY PROTEIN: uncharacterized protein EMH_0069130 [Eimeria mitis]CDJ34955.1 hypothetical protein, conserved [Eimeria mitis]